MFGQNKKQSDQIVSQDNAPASVSSNLPLATAHTMADDIAQKDATPTTEQVVLTEQVVPKPVQPLTTPTPTPTPASHASTISSNTGPFVTQDESASISTNAEKVQFAQTGQAPVISSATTSRKRHSIIDILIVVAIIVILIAVAAYYFLRPQSTTMPTGNTIIEKTQNILPDNQVDDIVPMEIPVSNLTHSIDIAQVATSTLLKQELNQLAQEQSVTGDTMMISVLDNGVLVPFNKFAQRFLPLLPQNLLTAMDVPFEIYIISNGTQQHIGIAALTRDSDTTNTLLRQNEMILAEALSPLFLFTPPEAVTVPMFSDGSYYGIPLRYYDFTPDGAQSINYAVHYERVFFTTNLMVLENLITRVLEADQGLLIERDLEGLIDEYPSIIQDSGLDTTQTIIFE